MIIKNTYVHILHYSLINEVITLYYLYLLKCIPSSCIININEIQHFPAPNCLALIL